MKVLEIAVIAERQSNRRIPVHDRHHTWIPMKSKHTDEQLSWLRGHLVEYETRAGGNIRGDAKKFALEKAVKYIEKWGVPDGEKETTMKEVRRQALER